MACVVGDPTFPVSLDAMPRAPRRARKGTARPKEPPALDQTVPTPTVSVQEILTTADAPPKAKKRKVNTSSKGTAIELAAIKILEAEGYKVHRCVRTGVKRGPFYFSQSNDVFGCIDLIAKKKGTRTRWIQVTADSGIGRKKKDLDEVPWDPVIDSVEIWRWVGGNARKHKTTGDWLERQYFQVYHLDHAYALDKDKRIPLVTPAPTPGGAAT
jgi:hypothetical protein